MTDHGHPITRRTALVGALAGTVATGCSPGPSGPSGKGVFAIEGATVFDGERSLGRANVLVDGARIVDAGPGVEIPEGVEVHDGRGKTALPGLIDCHVHARGLSPDGPRFGVTTELDMFAFLDTLGPYKKQRESTAPTVNSDVWTAGTLATVPGGHGTQFGPIPTIAPNADRREIDEFVARRFAEGSDYLKVIMEDWSLYYDEHGPTLSPEQVRYLIEAAHRHDALCIVHATRERDAGFALEAGADGLAHLPGDPISDRTVELARRNGAFVTSTLGVYNKFSCAGSARELQSDQRIGPLLTPEQRKYLNVHMPECMREIYPAAHDNVRALHEAGVTVLAGTDVSNPGIARGASLLAELELLTDGGLSAVEALRAATGAPVRRFPIGRRGRIAPDHRADLVLVAGDATQDIRAVRDIKRVWRNGRPIDRQP